MTDDDCTPSAQTSDPDDDEWCIAPRNALDAIRNIAAKSDPDRSARYADADAQRVRDAAARVGDILGTRRHFARAEQRDDDAIDLTLAQVMLSFACAFLPRPPENVVPLRRSRLPREGA